MRLRELFENSDNIKSTITDLLMMAKSNNLLKINLNIVVARLINTGLGYSRDNIIEVIKGIPLVQKVDTQYIYLQGYHEGTTSYDEEEAQKIVHNMAKKAAKRSIK